jgi:WD40 repeat protein
VLRGHTAALNWAAYSPGGGEVITGSDDGTARIWKVALGRQVRVLSQPGEGVAYVAFSPDSRQAVTGGGVARLWNLSTGSAQVLRVPADVIGVGGFSPDGRWFTAGGIEPAAAPPSAWVWDTATGSLLARLVRGHTDTVNSAAFSPDGRSLITASSDGTVLIHSCDALRPVNELLALAAARHYRPLTPLERRQYLNQP